MLTIFEPFNSLLFRDWIILVNSLAFLCTMIMQAVKQSMSPSALDANVQPSTPVATTPTEPSKVPVKVQLDEPFPEIQENLPTVEVILDAYSIITTNVTNMVKAVASSPAQMQAVYDRGNAYLDLWQEEDNILSDGAIEYARIVWTKSMSPEPFESGSIPTASVDEFIADLVLGEKVAFDVLGCSLHDTVANPEQRESLADLGNTYIESDLQNKNQITADAVRALYAQFVQILMTRHVTEQPPMFHTDSETH